MPWISSYERRDGTEVSSYWRSAPGARRRTNILLGVLIAVWAVGGGHVKVTPAGGGGGQQPAAYVTVHAQTGVRR
jgi:hypothetical protein